MIVSPMLLRRLAHDPATAGEVLPFLERNLIFFPCSKNFKLRFCFSTAQRASVTSRKWSPMLAALKRVRSDAPRVTIHTRLCVAQPHVGRKRHSWGDDLEGRAQ